MSFDRKNKRAAQAAAREAAQANGGAGDPSTSPPSSSSVSKSPTMNGSGIARSLKNSLDLGSSPPLPPTTTMTNAINEPVPPSSATATISTTPNAWNKVVSGLAAASSPPVGTKSLPQVAPTSPPKPQQSSAAAAPSALHQQLSSAAGPSPPTLPPHLHLSHQLPHQHSHLPPQALPSYAHLSTSPPNPSSANIFSTSPFSGSRALFMPSSYDSSSDHEGFPRSPPATHRTLLERNHSSGTASHLANGNGNGWNHAGTTTAFTNEWEEEGSDDGEEFDRAFLPSSLSDLLTPEELRRRREKGETGGGYDPWNKSSVGSGVGLASKSVPKDVGLAFGSAGRASASSERQTATVWNTLSASPASRSPHHVGTPTRTSPPHQPSLLSNSLLPPPTRPQPHYSSSFDPSTFLNEDPLLSTSPSSRVFPGPGSLPGGLAAGLSQLHLIPATHFGDTPPSGGNSFASLSPTLRPIGGGGGAHTPVVNGVTVGAATNGVGTGGAWSGPMSWSSDTSSSGRGFGGVGSAIPRRLSHQHGMGVNGGLGSGQGSPLVKAVGAAGAGGGGSGTGSAVGEDDEIQFELET
ncbi:zinc finger, CCCH-type protein, cps3 [Pseudohyphozyma bogoriensis]|nr:zinc finger, CCCH-type protein, cps3 [Pseudohyphozyma bogoriensis]